MDNNDEEKINKTQAELLITNFECSHDEISNIISIKPTRIWRKGEPYGAKMIRQCKENGFAIKGTLETSATLMEWIDNVISIIEPHIDKFQFLPHGVYIELSGWVYMYEGVPAIHLEKRHIEFLHAIKAEFDLDMYILTSDT